MRKTAFSRSAAALCALAIMCGSASAQALPDGWSTLDIGAVGAAGSVETADGSVTVQGAGADVWGSADAFRFVYTMLTGDGSIVARVSDVQGVNAWTKAGVMVRETLTSGSRHGFMLVSQGKGLAFQRRTTTGGASTHTSGGAGTAPRYVKLTREGSTVKAFTSADGASWTLVDSDTIAMGEKIYAGLAVSSHVKGVRAGATFTGVSVQDAAHPPLTLPPPVTAPAPPTLVWSSADIGAVGAAGSLSEEDGRLTVAGAGADVWGSADALHFAYTPMTGDGVIVARVSAVQGVNAWTKAGVMMRETLTAGSRHAFMLASPGKGLAFQRRVVTSGASTHSGASGMAPRYVKLQRSGGTFTASASLDGTTWTVVGSDTIAMAQTIYVGVAVSSHVKGVLATALFEHVTVEAIAAAPSAPHAPAGPVTGTAVNGELRVLHWNAHHGGTGTDGRYDPDRFANWIVQFKADIVSLNEMDNQTQVGRIENLLEAKTGKEWTSVYDNRGNALLSPLPGVGQSICVVNPSVGRKASHLGVMVGGRTINVWSAHLGLDSSSLRLGEVNAMVTCGQSWPEARIVAGDFNAQAGSAEIARMKEAHNDAWTTAKAMGTAANYPGNCDGCTRNSRIDYIFTSKQSGVSLKSAHVLDTRDAKGVMASDHKPLLAVYDLD